MIEEMGSTAFLQDCRRFCSSTHLVLYSVFLFTAMGTSMLFISLTSCDFINVQIGFIPSNIALNTTEFKIGFWSYQSKGKALLEFNDDCTNFTDKMELAFFEDDGIWKALRLTRLISMISSCIALFFISLICFCRFPAWRAWHHIMLPAICTTFFFGASTLLVRYSYICVKRVWEPSEGKVRHQFMHDASKVFPQSLSIRFQTIGIYTKRGRIV